MASMMRMAVMSALAGAAMLAGSGAWGGEVTGYAVAVESPRDAAEISLEGKTLSVKVKSATGIGRMEIGLKKDGEWPEAVVLLLRSGDGKPLRELEGFTLAGEGIRIEGSRRTSGKMDCRDGGPQDPKLPGKPPRQVNVTVEKTDKALTVTIPGKLLAGERKLRIQWVDFYR